MERERRGKESRKDQDKRKTERSQTTLRERERKGGCKGRPGHPKNEGKRAKRKAGKEGNKLSRAHIRKARTKARHP